MKLACLGNKRKTHSACLRNKRKKQDAGKIACLRYKRKKRTEKQGKRGEYVCEIKGKKHLYHEHAFYIANKRFGKCKFFLSYCEQAVKNIILCFTNYREQAYQIKYL